MLFRSNRRLVRRTVVNPHTRTGAGAGNVFMVSRYKVTLFGFARPDGDGAEAGGECPKLSCCCGMVIGEVSGGQGAFDVIQRHREVVVTHDSDVH